MMAPPYPTNWIKQISLRSKTFDGPAVYPGIGETLGVFVREVQRGDTLKYFTLRKVKFNHL